MDSKPDSSANKYNGIPLIEVFNIIYLGMDEVVPEKQLGTIKLVSYYGQCAQYLYREEEVDLSKPVLKYGDAIVTTIKVPTFTFEDDDVYLDFNIFNGAYKGIVHLPWKPRMNEASLCCVEFNSIDYTGKILVHTGNFAKATVAKVEVKLSDNPTPANIYGDIFASNSKLDSSDAASLLFHKNFHDRLLVGCDGVISFVKSFVAVPFHSVLFVEVFLNVDGLYHTATARFDAKNSRVPELFVIEQKNVKLLVTVTWGQPPASGMDDQPYVNVNQGTVGVSSSGFEVDVENFHLRKHHYRLSRIITYIMSRVLCNCNRCIQSSTSVVDFRAKFVEQLHPVILFNLIQAAHHLQIKSLMDLTCQTLVNKVSSKSVEEIMKVFNMDDYYIQVAKPEKRTFFGGDIFHSPHVDLEFPLKRPTRVSVVSILRERKKEAFINRSHLVDLPISPFSTKRLPLIKKRNTIFDRCVKYFVESMVAQSRDLDKQLEAIKWLNNLIKGDPGFTDCLTPVAVKHLLQIVQEIENSKDRGYIVVTIQSLAVHILSRAVTCKSFYEYQGDAIPALVKLMSAPQTDLKTAAVIALMHLAYAYPPCIPYILEKGALEKAQEIAIEFKSSSSHSAHELIRSVAKLLAVVFYRSCPQDKVDVALAIVENLFENDSLLTHDHAVSACYELQYLTYRRPKLVGEVSNKIIRKLIGIMFNCCTVQNTEVARVASGVPGSVLGVVGNIVRWGSLCQIKILTEDEDSQLLQCLGRMLCSVYKKFNKEACQIISNIAARSRSETWIHDMHKANLIEPLCSLLEKDMYESNVKMEAAWAIFNSIYGDKYRPIDHFSEKRS